MRIATFNLQNLRGQSLLFRCLETGFVTTAPALTRYQQGRGIDPSRRGDVSAELVVDQEGKPVKPRRVAAVDTESGEKVVPNPNSAAVWHYRGQDAVGRSLLCHHRRRAFRLPVARQGRAGRL